MQLRIKIHCQYCGLLFDKNVHNKVYCSNRCKSNAFYHFSHKEKMSNPNYKLNYYTARKRAWTRYNTSSKNKLNQQRYRGSHLDYFKEYYSRNSEQIRANVRTYQMKNKDKVKMWIQHRDMEKSRKRGLRYALSSKGKLAAKRYSSSPKGKQTIVLKSQRRRERLAKVIHSYTKHDWMKIKSITGGVCPKCKKNVGLNNLTIDHNPPLSKAPEGFIYTKKNIGALCGPCNSSKRDVLY